MQSTTVKRNKVKTSSIGQVKIGNRFKVAIQSMTKTATTDVAATLRQVRALQDAGCDIIRIAVPTKADTQALAKIIEKADVPIVADIHFSPERAIEAIEAGAAKIRINPGNIKNPADVRRILDCAKSHKIAIRIGINEASIRNLKSDTSQAKRVRLMVGEMSKFIRLFERNSFDNIVISAKSTDVGRTIEVNRAFAKSFDYPIHIGLTHAGLPEDALVPSAVALGTLLNEGIGDTIRVSLAGNPVGEIAAAQDILGACGLFERQTPELIVCPTCGRCMIDVVSLAKKVKKAIKDIQSPIKVAVMGCIVNGPGEAADADVAICAANKKGFLYSKGKKIATVPEENLLAELLSVVNKMAK
jgi:(E)-4-hydroxy-3-methylbut-2-enyl-diphosphate synthase